MRRDYSSLSVGSGYKIPRHAINCRTTSWRHGSTRITDDARRRGLGEIVPLIESLGRAVTSLREADWNDDARSDARPDLGDGERPR